MMDAKDDDLKHGLWGCASLFFVVGTILAFCFQCSYDRKQKAHGGFDFNCGPVPEMRAKDTRRTTPPEVPLGSARSGNADAMKPHREKQGYDSIEDWYYAEMDVFGSDEYPDM